MSELEQLRKEINELRERVAMLEARPFTSVPATRTDWTNPMQPTWIRELSRHFPPGTILC